MIDNAEKHLDSWLKIQTLDGLQGTCGEHGQNNNSKECLEEMRGQDKGYFVWETNEGAGRSVDKAPT